MDFGTLLHVAKKNSETVKNSESKYYSTKFSAPKKESKEKTLSDNIKKFLAKREHEEREKARIEKEKRDQLLAMRDERSKNKIKKMLKVIKSANKSVLEDAVDSENTAVTLHGPEQPDEDDYGYVSQEAAAYYKKYMEKVKSLPDDNKFAPSRPISKHDLSGTKDRVRAAIQKEQDEKNGVKRSKLKQSETIAATTTTTAIPTNSTSVPISSSSHRRKDLYDPSAERELSEKKRREEEQKRSKLKKPAPPPFDFKELLKLAEKKQHEPVEIVVETKKEPERLLTKKEKRELEERQKYLEDRERRKKEGHTNPNSKSQVNGKIPKIDTKDAPIAAKKPPNDKTAPSASNTQKSSSSTTASAAPSKDGFKRPSTLDQQTTHNHRPNNATKNSSKISADQKNNNHPVNNIKQRSEEVTRNQPSNGLKTSSKVNNGKALPSVGRSTGALSSSKANQSSSVRSKDIPMNRKPPPPSDRDAKSRQFPPADLQRTRQFPPSDVRTSKPVIKKAPKRRIIDDDDEYDSELDDFIDDGPEGDQNYSSYIKEIFGYDKSRYRDVDEDADDAAMESNFAQQMKEEYVSKKIGLMEDLEDMRLEAEEKKMKALMKKRKLK